MSAKRPFQILLDFNEGDFELAAQKMHGKLGPATPETLNRMLQLYDFPQ